MKETSNGEPYDLGVKDAQNGEYANPYVEFTYHWGRYNQGYNSVANPWMTKS